MKKRQQVITGVTVTGVAAKVTAELVIFKRKPDSFNFNDNPVWVNPSNDELKCIFDMTKYGNMYRWGRGITMRQQFAPRSSFYLAEFITKNFN